MSTLDRDLGVYRAGIRRRAARLLAVSALAASALAACACGASGGVEPARTRATAASRSPTSPPPAHASSVLGSWSIPQLVDPTVIHITTADQHLELDRTKDYVILPPATPLTNPGGVSINGGRNVVWVGGEIAIPGTVPPTQKNGGRGLYLLNQTGTIHIEGLRIDGDGLHEGIDIGAPRATVQLRNLRIGPVRNPPGLATHPDVIQAWGGPKVLRIDGLTASTEYQGIFLQPQAYGKVDILRVELHDVDITGSASSAYLLWAATPVPLRARDVFLDGPRTRSTKQLLWPTPQAWPGVRRARVAPFVPAQTAGIRYRRAGARR
jgi:hypothetical protein